MNVRSHSRRAVGAPTAPIRIRDLEVESRSRAVLVAEQIHGDLLSTQLPPGSVFGSEMQLRTRYSVGAGALREAIRLLELREFGRMRRGRGGGFVTNLPTLHLVAQALSSYLCLRGATLGHLVRSHGAIGEVAIDLATERASAAEDLIDTPRGSGSATRVLGLVARRSGDLVVAMMADVLHALLGYLPSSISQCGLPAGKLPCDGSCGQRVLAAIEKNRTQSAHRHLATHVRHLEQALPEKSSPIALWYRLSERINVHETRAGQVSRNIIIEIVNGRLAPGVRLGATSDVCKRYAVSKAIGSQVVRLLEMMDVVCCQRGRGGGLFVREPSSRRPVIIVHQHLLSRKAKADEVERVIRMIRNTSHFAADPGNPILALMLECLQTYTSSSLR